MKKFYDSLRRKTSSKDRGSKSGPQKSQTPADVSENDGFHLVFQSNDPSIDIVALHGQGGNWKTSWTDRVTGCFWLQDLLPAVVPNARVLSYDYGATKSSILVAEDFLSELTRLRKESSAENRPIVFLAHSFGGLLIKGILAISREPRNYTEADTIASSTDGILFFGVPREADKGMAQILPSDADGKNESVEIQALRRDFRWLQESNAMFSLMCGQFKTKYFAEIADGYARSPAHDAGSSESIDSDIIVLGKTHGQMIRFPNVEDADFQKVSKVLSATVTEAIK